MLSQMPVSPFITVPSGHLGASSSAPCGEDAATSGRSSTGVHFRILGPKSSSDESDVWLSVSLMAWLDSALGTPTSVALEGTAAGACVTAVESEFVDWLSKDTEPVLSGLGLPRSLSLGGGGGGGASVAATTSPEEPESPLLSESLLEELAAELSGFTEPSAFTPPIASSLETGVVLSGVSCVSTFSGVAASVGAGSEASAPPEDSGTAEPTFDSGTAEPTRSADDAEEDGVSGTACPGTFESLDDEPDSRVGEFDSDTGVPASGVGEPVSGTAEPVSGLGRPASGTASPEPLEPLESSRCFETAPALHGYPFGASTMVYVGALNLNKRLVTLDLNGAIDNFALGPIAASTCELKPMTQTKCPSATSACT